MIVIIGLSMTIGIILGMLTRALVLVPSAVLTAIFIHILHPSTNWSGEAGFDVLAIALQQAAFFLGSYLAVAIIRRRRR